MHAHAIGLLKRNESRQTWAVPLPLLLAKWIRTLRPEFDHLVHCRAPKHRWRPRAHFCPPWACIGRSAKLIAKHLTRGSLPVIEAAQRRFGGKSCNKLVVTVVPGYVATSHGRSMDNIVISAARGSETDQPMRRALTAIHTHLIEESNDTSQRWVFNRNRTYRASSGMAVAASGVPPTPLPTSSEPATSIKQSAMMAHTVTSCIKTLRSAIQPRLAMVVATICRSSAATVLFRCASSDSTHAMSTPRAELAKFTRAVTVSASGCSSASAKA